MLYRALVLAMCVSQSAALKVFVSGAGGQTGQSVFRKMLARPEFSPLGVVRSEESKAALVESGVPAESVVVCDVTDADAVMSAMKGCEAVVIATSAKPAPTGEMKESGGPIFGFPNGQPEVVDWLGQKSQIDAAKAQGLGTHVVICSSMGGTDPNHMLNSLGRETLEDGSTKNGEILKWKRKAEVYLTASGLPWTVVHPGGLVNEAGGVRALCLGVDDNVKGTENRNVPREDVAEVLLQSLLLPALKNRAVDLVSKPEGEGAAPSDWPAWAEAELKDVGTYDYSLGEVA
uniref:NAD(P)-binding domain-containing protein n=1 Tax=Phaeocystis antarctica TaxID=33657 RepID=A0A7S0DWH7_9EUKA